MSKNGPFERYEGINEDAKRQDVPVKDNKADNSCSSCRLWPRRRRRG